MCRTEMEMPKQLCLLISLSIFSAMAIFFVIKVLTGLFSLLHKSNLTYACQTMLHKALRNRRLFDIFDKKFMIDTLSHRLSIGR
jgi:hypothetical protein